VKNCRFVWLSQGDLKSCSQREKPVSQPSPLPLNCNFTVPVWARFACCPASNEDSRLQRRFPLKSRRRDFNPDIPLGGAKRLHEPCRMLSGIFPPVFRTNSPCYRLVKREKICSEFITAASRVPMENPGSNELCAESVFNPSPDTTDTSAGSPLPAPPDAASPARASGTRPEACGGFRRALRCQRPACQ